MTNDKAGRFAPTTRMIFPALLAAAMALAACGRHTEVDATSDPGTSGGAPAPAAITRTYRICPGGNATSEALTAFFDAREGDTIEFCAGRFEMSTGLILSGKRGITIKGAGRDATILSFKNSDAAEGLNVSHVDGIVMQGFTVEDTPGNSIRVFRSRYVTFRDLRAQWTGYQTCPTDPTAVGSCSQHGAYGLYPVQCQQVLIEDSEAFGASDAGIYVGQTSDVIVRRTRAEYNVAGFEFENTYRAEFVDNIATHNTGGFLIFDLPGLAQFGEKNLVHGNRSFDNNQPNFAPVGNIVGNVPRGTGMLVLASDQLEIYDNEISDHDTLGLGIVNYGLIDAAEADLKYDFYPEGVHVHGNRFRDNGGNIQLPSRERGAASLLPLLLKIKNFGRSAHIVWDGAVDAPNGCVAYPVDAQGVPLNQPNASEPARYEARADERGRPNYSATDPGPNCGAGKRFNAWKFDGAGAIKLPENGLCINEDNQFENTQLRTALTTPFLNAHLTSSDPAQLIIDLLKPASTNLAPHRCQLPARPAPRLQLPFVPDPNNGDRRPTDAEVAAACNGGRAGAVNAAALAYNCPRLDQYGLFADAQNPLAAPVNGLSYELNTTLFSDYSSKYRFLYIPAGQAARYLDHNSGVTATLDFPVGTVIAKSFAFKSGASERVVETRLLIKRQTASGVSWIGLPYIWRDDAGGRRVAELHVEGGSASVNYDYDDPDPDVRGANGQRAHYSGSVPRYAIPAALNCVTCHGGDDREPGAAPIGLKARNLNKVHRFENGTTQNQLSYLAANGLLTGLPADLAAVEKLPRWNVPGDAGDLPNSKADIHHRVRAYLEVNCVHCHSGSGSAANSGLFLDSFRVPDVRYGICKRPIAAGRGSGEGRRYDIVPKDSLTSILPYRVASAEAGVRMPPVARSVVHGEAANLITQWIDTVLPTEDTEDNTCSGLLPR